MAPGSDRAVDWTDPDAAALFQTAIETLPGALLLVTPAGAIALVNRAAEHLFGYERNALIGQPMERLVPEGSGAARAIGVRRDGSRFEVALHIRRVQTANVSGAVIEVRAEAPLHSVTASRAHPPAAPAQGVAESPAARRVTEMIAQVAATRSTVLLLGEAGTGKELCASRLHAASSRREHPMVRVNCAAIPSMLIESELFGRERGTFSGVLARQAGRFESADQGTIFLDEIGDLPLDAQVKLLRVLEEGRIERLGSARSIRIDTRLIAATHQDLEQRVAEGTFREDLYYRLHVFPIRVPALRERAEDIPHLVWQFVGEFSKAFGRRIESISPESLTALQRYPWPGNIRELRNTVERAMIVSTGKRLTIPAPAAAAAGSSLKLRDVEKQHLHAVLVSTHWRIRGEAGAAARLGLKPATLETRMARLGLKRPHSRWRSS